MWKLLAFLLLLSFPRCLNAAITIDDFSAGPLNVTLTAANPSLHLTQVGLPEAAVIGGIRRHSTLIDSPVDPNSEATVVIDTNSETYQVATNANLEATFLSYGLRSLAEGTADQALNLDLTEFDALRIEVISSEISSDLGLSFRSGVNEGTFDFTFDIISFPASATPYSVFLRFSIFLNEVDFTDIDSITLSGGAPAGFNITLGGIFAVPEPASLALALLGTAALFSTRRQRRNA